MRFGSSASVLSVAEDEEGGRRRAGYIALKTTHFPYFTN